MDRGLRLGIRIRDWLEFWIEDLELVLGIGIWGSRIWIGDWDQKLGIGIRIGD